MDKGVQHDLSGSGDHAALEPLAAELNISKDNIKWSHDAW